MLFSCSVLNIAITISYLEDCTIVTRGEVLTNQLHESQALCNKLFRTQNESLSLISTDPSKNNELQSLASNATATRNHQRYGKPNDLAN